VFFNGSQTAARSTHGRGQEKKNSTHFSRQSSEMQLVSTPRGDGSDTCAVATCVRSIVLIQARTRKPYNYTQNRGASAPGCSYTHAARAPCSIRASTSTAAHIRTHVPHTHTAQAHMLHTQLQQENKLLHLCYSSIGHHTYCVYVHSTPCARIYSCSGTCMIALSQTSRTYIPH